MLKELSSLVDQLKMERRDLWNAVQGLSIEQLLEPFPGVEWSIKDELAHIASNELLMTDIMRCIATGAPSPIPPDFDLDKFDREQVAAWKDRTVAEVWNQLDESRSRLLEFLDSLTPEQLERRGTHPLEGMMTVKEFLVVVYSHEVNHVRGIIEPARRLRHRAEAQ